MALSSGVISRMEQRDYFSHVPFEIMLEIVRHLEGTEMALLYQISKYFNYELDCPAIWKLVYDNMSDSTTNYTICVDNNTINWRQEVKLLSVLRMHSRKIQLLIKFKRLYSLQAVVAYKNHLFTNVGVIKENDTRKLNLAGIIRRYYGHYTLQGTNTINHIVLTLSGPLWSENKFGSCHAIHDLANEAVIYKKLFHYQLSTLQSFNRTIAILNSYAGILILGLLIECKHTDEAIWNKSNAKNGPCEKCAILMELRIRGYKDSMCSQVNEKVVLIPRKICLKVVDPFEGVIFDIENDTCQIGVDTCTLAYQYKNTPRVISEQVIDIDGQAHHIVHCTVNKQHRFYDLTVKKMMATINCWIMHVWIPNTCYLAMATRDTVIVIDFHNNKIVSQFKPKDNQNAFRTVIKALQASRTSTVLLIGMTSKYWMSGKRKYKYNDSVILLYSALTGARISHLIELTWPQKFQIELTEDEKKMVLWKEQKLYIYELSNTLTCLQEHLRERK